MNLKRIDIGTVLNILDDTVDEITGKVKTYGIRFVTGDGRIRELTNCRKNVKNPHQEVIKNTDGKGRRMFNLKYHGAVLLWDEDGQVPRSPKASLMFQFRDYNSKKWLDIFH